MITSSTDAPLLLVENLTFRYRAREERTIRDVSFTLRAGQVLLIAGASGCGKTTLIRCINGLAPRSYKGELEGRILLAGKDYTSRPLSAISQVVGTVLQDPERQILGSLVRNEVAFGLENLGLPREEIVQRVGETLDYLRIGHLAERQTFYLSGGEKQKVAVAGVLAMRPQILLLDEPLASLDPTSALEALQMIRQLADEGRAVVIIEHRVEDVLKIQPELAMFMVDGQVRYFGPTDGLRETVDYREVKLPASMIIEQAAADPMPDYVPPVLFGAGPAERPLIAFEQVSFRYGDDDDDEDAILHDVSLDVHRGDVIALLGPNGAGKTTLVKHAIGLLKPRSGRVLVDGRDTREMSVAQAARAVGYVFQSPSHMLFAPTVREELAFGPTNLRMAADEIERSVREALEIVKMGQYLHDPPLSLSFGQQKRISIAAILAMRSRILVMDEPTAGQDYKNYMSFMDAILQLPNFEAILFITHDVDLAVAYASRVVLMDAGTVAADGPPQEVLADAGLLQRSHVVPTSLLAENLRCLPQTGRFMRAELLAHIAGAGGMG